MSELRHQGKVGSDCTLVRRKKTFREGKLLTSKAHHDATKLQPSCFRIAFVP